MGSLKRNFETMSAGAVRDAADATSDFHIAAIDFDAPDAANQLTTSLRTTGFAVLKTHPVDWKLVDDLYKEWRIFLQRLARGASKEGANPEDSSAEALYAKYTFNPEKQDGYFPMSVSEKAKGANVKDIKHYYQCYFPWGRYPEEVSDGARQLYGQTTSLGRKLLQWIEADIRKTLPTVAKKLDEKLKCSMADAIGMEQTMLRVLHYPAYDESSVEPGAIRAAAHEDINFITVLPSGSARGLEVWSKADQKWCQVPVENECIIINVGDMLQELTDHAYVSTTHRVVKPADAGTEVGDRLSVPTFIHARPDTFLSEKYPKARLYLEERLRQLGVLK